MADTDDVKVSTPISASSTATLGVLWTILIVGASIGLWLVGSLHKVEQAQLESDAQSRMALQSLTHKIEALVARVDRTERLEAQMLLLSRTGTEALRNWVDLFAAKNPTLSVPTIPK